MSAVLENPLKKINGMVHPHGCSKKFPISPLPIEAANISIENKIC